jgi:flap endonuclease-1
MGIKNLHRILEKYAPSCYQTRHLSYYSFKKIAIDISLYLYKYKAIHGDKWVECFISLVIALRKWDVHCIFIYDGKAPMEKIEEQLRRRDTRAKMGDKIELLEKEIKDFEEHGIVGDLLSEMNEKVGAVVSLFRKNTRVNIAAIKDKLDSMKSMMISIVPEDIVLSQQLFDLLQIPYLTAPAEAECYASLLCVDGKVDAVLSEDTDVLAYGTPCFLTKVDTRADTVVEINYSAIMNETGMSRDTLTDLCIMCGCDYNSNIPQIGHEKSYQLLSTHGTIEGVIEYLKTLKKGKVEYTDEVCSILKYTRCREMFATYPVECFIPYCGTPDFQKLQEFLFVNHIRSDINVLRKHLSARELVFEE